MLLLIPMPTASCSCPRKGDGGEGSVFTERADKQRALLGKRRRTRDKEEKGGDVIMRGKLCDAKAVGWTANGPEAGASPMA